MPGTLVSDLPNREIQEFLKGLQLRGVTVDTFRATRFKVQLMDHVARVIATRNHGWLDLRVARAVMGKNFFGAEEWWDFFKLKVPHELEKEPFPFGAEVLFAPCPFTPGALVKDTHFAFLGASCASSEDEQNAVFNGQMLNLTWWRERIELVLPDNIGSLTTATCQERWYLMYKGVMPNSKRAGSLGWFTPSEYEAPTVVELVVKNALWQKLTGQFAGPLGQAIITNNNEPGGEEFFKVMLGRIKTSVAFQMVTSGPFTSHFSPSRKP